MRLSRIYLSKNQEKVEYLLSKILNISGCKLQYSENE